MYLKLEIQLRKTRGYSHETYRPSGRSSSTRPRLQPTQCEASSHSFCAEGENSIRREYTDRNCIRDQRGCWGCLIRYFQFFMGNLFEPDVSVSVHSPGDGQSGSTEWSGSIFGTSGQRGRYSFSRRIYQPQIAANSSAGTVTPRGYAYTPCRPIIDDNTDNLIAHSTQI